MLGDGSGRKSYSKDNAKLSPKELLAIFHMGSKNKNIQGRKNGILFNTLVAARDKKQLKMD